ncbi:MAG TPA: PTS sugar transporter subunit IIA [Kiloniellales bacterium]|nr:PTS sugar transporter subunit IIA [Kiloniellales bacterium]
MAINAFFSPDDVILGLSVADKRELFQALAAASASRGGPPEKEALDALNAREKLGSTALGKGVGLPHAELKAATSPLMLFVRLEAAIDFDAQDDEPVDLVFLVLWPESSNKEFLSTMSTLCRVLRDSQTLRRLRQAETTDRIVEILHEECQSE